jgi:hypothetical protein
MKKVYKKILSALGFGIDTVIFGWIMLWGYINIFKTPTVSFTDLLCVALILFASLMYSFRIANKMYKKPLYDQLDLIEREQVRQEFHDQRYDGQIRRREDEKARERTHKEKEKRDATEAVTLLYEHMPERVQLRSTILRHELQELGEYDDQEIGGTEQLTRIAAPIPKFSGKDESLLWSMSCKIADAIIGLAIENHTAEVGGSKALLADAPELYGYKWELRRLVQEDAKDHLTNLDRYYYTPATPMWRAEDFKRYASEED